MLAPLFRWLSITRQMKRALRMPGILVFPSGGCFRIRHFGGPGRGHLARWNDSREAIICWGCRCAVRPMQHCNCGATVAALAVLKRQPAAMPCLRPVEYHELGIAIAGRFHNRASASFADT